MGLQFTVPPMRFGEATHPGPASDFLRISTSNPSGLRTKESLLLEDGVGIHSVSETQLSHVTLPRARATLLACGRKLNRQVRALFGAPAPVRPTSQWAGTWTGVAQVSDFPAHLVRLPWTQGEWSTGRIMVAQHMVSGVAVLLASVYGFAPGPTFPDARQRTDKLLEAVTKEVVLGRKGIRIVAGDYNHDEGSLEQLSIWREQGWVEVQTLAQHRWAQAERPTCKHATKRDFLYLSPEAATLCHGVSVWDCFAEHSTVSATFAVSSVACRAMVWPLPSDIPWQEVDVERWTLQEHACPPLEQDPTGWMHQFAVSFEGSLNGHLTSKPDANLPSNCRGRSRRTAPQVRQEVQSFPKASRDGEEQLCHDFVSLEVRRWFSQVRRLQSLLHALRADKQTIDAQVYRASLWQAIKHAKGFRHGFPRWWSSRPVQLQSSPPAIPIALPPCLVAQAIFSDFRENFRKFEAWCIRHRGKILQSKYEEARTTLFRDLRSAPAPQVDIMQVERSYVVAEVDSSSSLVALDQPLDCRGFSTWHLNGQPVTISHPDGVLCEVDGVDVIGEADELTQTQILSSVDDIHQEFLSLWIPRWTKHVGLSSVDWQRVTAFAMAFLPSLQLSLPPISVESWMKQVKRLKVKAARGPDGWSRADLLTMPRQRTAALLEFLHKVESGAIRWPAQMTVGFVISLAKPGNRMDAQGFRPICLFSLIYRLWAGIRTRQVLRTLAPWLDSDAMGFIPEKEAAAMWTCVQCQIELGLQSGIAVSGYSTDVIKAFNNLPRDPLLAAALHLGIPDSVVTPWRHFLQDVKRYFKVRDCLSDPVQSTCGFPEGDPLSPLAMVISNTIFHAYMSAFCPCIRTLSYADNYSGVAQEARQVTKGLASAHACCDMLGLELDESKTFVWSTDATQRKAFKVLGFHVTTHARELGGALSFEARTHNAALVERGANLAPLWAALSRAKGPLQFRLSMLPAKFWAIALHGSLSCPFSDSHFAMLRSQAVKALHLKKAGVSPMLRLSLAPCMQADPGFYNLWSSLRDFRRLLSKLPGLLFDWKMFMAQFDGRLFQGPFSKMLHLFSTIHWTLLKPPRFADHEGLIHDLMRIPEALLLRLAEDAWLQHVSHCHRHRRTMQDLVGIESSLLGLDSAQLLPLDLARLASIQSGAFICPYQHAKFDNSLTGQCMICGVPDTVKHRIVDCPRFAAARAGKEDTLAGWDSLPVCVTHHLLMPADRKLRQLRQLLHHLPDTTEDFWSTAASNARQHLFTDGACTQCGVQNCGIVGRC